MSPHSEDFRRALHRKMVLSREFEMGLAAVVATQLWHHRYIDANLAELS